MVTSFFEQLNELKTVVSSSAPIEERLVRIEPLLRDEDLQREFWNLLDDERWVPVLKKAGMFDHPPAPKQVSGERISFPYWGQSKYLAKVASRLPSEVAAIFAGLNTENVSIIGDMLDAARVIPIGEATALVPAVRRAAAARTLWVHWKDASDFCVRLAQEGEGGISLLLAEALFAPKGTDVKAGPIQSEIYWYREGLRKVTPILAKTSTWAFLPMISDWLEALVRSSKNVDFETGDDYSYIWRPAIEEHEQNNDHNLVSAVLGCVRDAFEVGIRAGEISLAAALDLLDSRELAVFRRIRIHLLAEFGDQEGLRVTHTILDRNLFDDHRLKHEYSRLVGRQLACIEVADREQWYRWVDEGPDMSDFDENVRSQLQREPTASDRQSRIDYWKFEKLHWVHDALEGPRREFYERMLAEHGTPELADLNIRTGTVLSEETPTTADRLSSMTFEQAVDWVSSWQPARNQVLGASVSGLSAIFGEYVARRPEEFSRKAPILRDRPQSFVSTYIKQMSVAIKAGREVFLLPVLELCEWVVGLPVDEGWQSVRDEISELIQTACQATRENRPLFNLSDFRRGFWTLLSHLYRDRSKSYIIRETSSDDLRLRDYFDLGLNSPRGRAVAAGLDFARWVALHLTAAKGGQDAVPGGMQSIPELGELLEWQIDTENQSLEAMAMIGARMGVINWIDGGWLANNAHRLFSLERLEQAPQHAFGWAAWNAFLVWVRPHIVFYRALHDQFVYAVRQSALVKVNKQDRPQPMYRLGEHLMVLYGRGQLPLNDRVLEAFLRDAHPAIRRHAIGSIGSSFSRELLPLEVVERFMALWDGYWGDRGKSDAMEDPEAVLFGSWFSSGIFPQKWALRSLEEFVEVVPVPEPDHSVIDRLAKDAHVDILQAIRIVDRMVRGDHESWRIHGWEESLKLVLEGAIRSGAGARASASEVIDYLGRRGYTTFGALLVS